MDRASDGNLMPFQRFKIMFPRATMHQLEKKDKSVVLNCIRKHTFHN